MLLAWRDDSRGGGQWGRDERDKPSDGLWRREPPRGGRDEGYRQSDSQWRSEQPRERNLPPRGRDGPPLDREQERDLPSERNAGGSSRDDRARDDRPLDDRSRDDRSRDERDSAPG